jgi:hypothetical protein
MAKSQQIGTKVEIFLETNKNFYVFFLKKEEKYHNSGRAERLSEKNSATF